MADKEQDNIKQEYNSATVGLNQDQSLNQVKKGALTYALNATVENFDANSVSYQNEVGNELCLEFPQGYVVIGNHFIGEKNKHIFMLANPETGESQIGYMDNNDCQYKIYVDDPCLGFSIHYPIHKIVHKITNCTTEIYWGDNVARRYLDLDHIPYLLKSGSNLCDPVYSNQIDCNQLKVQPDFPIPTLDIIDVVSGGNLTAGTVQFTVQYSDAIGNPYTSYYSHTNPTPIADVYISTVNFDYPVGKSVVVNVGNLDVTGHFQYFNLAVIKTINGISSPELVGTYFIDSISKQITYTGQDVSSIRLSMNDIFEKYPYYDLADDLTAVQDILVWDNLTSIDRVNYQSIWSKVSLQWETYRIPATENYADELNATNLRSYLRDEVYPFEGVFLLRNGKQTDSFHIPARIKSIVETSRPDVPDTDPDFIGTPDYTLGGVGYNPYWKIYNTATVTGISSQYTADPTYKGPYQYGEFAYWESTEEYPCNKELWGDLAGQKIRHHKFPDVLVSPIYETKLFSSPNSMVMGNDAVFPIGVKIDIQQIQSLINSSNLTPVQKADIVGFKIVRGDRSTNKSIVAKGILRNVGLYEREEQSFYYPNYPYNDLREDPFLMQNNNAFEQLCDAYEIIITALTPDPAGGADYAFVQYTDCNSNRQTAIRLENNDPFQQCSLTRPVILGPATGTVGLATYEIWEVLIRFGFSVVGWNDPVKGYREVPFSAGYHTLNVVPDTGPPAKISKASISSTYLSVHTANTPCTASLIQPSIDDNLRDRQIFNSPETSFGQPFLGNILRLENIMFGSGKAHFVEVKNNAKYKLITEEAQRKALDSSNVLGSITSDFSASAMFAAYQAYLTIYINGITRKNFAYSFNSIADYNYSKEIPNDLGIKQRNVNIARYLIPGVQSIGDDYNINNYQRESSVYLKMDEDVPFPSVPGVSEYSRFTISEIGNCNSPAKENPIQVISYYASLKNEIVNQWGQIYSYETIDTGFQEIINSSIHQNTTIFGGDTFIGRFAFKTKLPFFIDNRVGAPDDSDIFYDEIGNIAYPKYWHSARSILKDYVSGGGLLSNIISYKAHNFDCPNDVLYVTPIYSGTTTTTTTVNPVPGSVITNSDLTYYDGYFYLFSYGIPSFYCESSYNLDLRQSFDNREGDFFPHVSTGIPDDWVQEHFVSIANDNTYHYNTTFSKQNKENTFTHLPLDWEDICYTHFTFRGIYSNMRESEPTNRVNNWLIYTPASYFDFPQNYGKLTSLDGIQNKAVLARFENKSLLYNNLLTLNTSNPQAAYLGNPGLFKGAPPIDFAETDLGYVGSQHKFLLKIPHGQITVDAKRGQIFLISDTQAIDLTGFGCGMNRFFTDHLAFEILKYYPEIDVDNNFVSIGLHGVFDSKYDRVIITKLDYIPLDDNIIYNAEEHKFYLEKIINESIIRKEVFLSDTTYFCNKSWTLSYNMNTKSWISFHSYIPNWYIAENNFFYSGSNSCCEDFEVIVGVPVPIPTTTTTTTFNCVLDVDILDAFPITTTTTTTTTEAPPLELTFDDIANVPVADASSVSDWNTFFDLPTYGGVFTSVEVVGNVVRLIGGNNVTLKDYLFYYNTNLLSVIDNGTIITAGNSCFGQCMAITIFDLPSLITAGVQCFQDTTAITTFNLPVLTTAGDGCFYGSSATTFNLPSLTTAGDQCFWSSQGTSLSVLYIPSCVSLGTTTGYDSVFIFIEGQTITLTIPSVLMTCNGGNPDGDIQDLQANNYVTIITV